jgi:hypothetical protein
VSDDGKTREPAVEGASGRRGFLYTVVGGAIAALSGWLAGVFPREAKVAEEVTTPGVTGTRFAALEAKVAQLAGQVLAADAVEALARLEGENNERVVFEKSELTVTNPEGVLLNLVATNGHVGIRFYKDFDFGNEQVTSPWHMGFIEGVEGYQGLAILRDWRFTAALWDEDGRLLLGRLDPHPPANDPAKARLHVRGTLDEVQALVEASADQTADIFQVVGRDGNKCLAVNGAGQVLLGSQDDPKELILHDTQNKSAYSLSVTNGQLTLARVS